MQVAPAKYLNRPMGPALPLDIPVAIKTDRYKNGEPRTMLQGLRSRISAAIYGKGIVPC